MAKQRLILALVIILLGPAQALAHQLSTAYLSVHQDAELAMTGQWQIRWLDLHQAITLDEDQDGQLTWREVSQNKENILEYLYSTLVIGNDSTSCQMQINPELQTASHFNEGYLAASFSASCAEHGPLTLSYNAIYEIDEEHKVLINISRQDESISAVLSAEQRDIALTGEAYSALDTFVQYLEQGVIHIWLGIDHIVFLLALLLTAVLVRKDKQWLGSSEPGKMFKNTFWIVSAFTLAHSITLTATAMNWINMDSSWVELSIALSVLIAACNNIWPVIVRLGWLTFGFGLLHGFGFASVLAQLGLHPQQTLLSVLAFNLGVELGQLVILFATFPVLMLVRSKVWYRKGGMQLASACIGVMAVIWSLERI